MLESTKKKRLKWGPFLFGGVAGMVLLAAFLAELRYTAREEFCISCHEMASTVYVEYKETAHYMNKSGVRATCTDCHLSHNLIEMVGRKVKAAKEVFHHLKGTIDTKEKFEGKRLVMAENVWAEMMANDSRECRYCHSAANMDYTKQSRRAMEQHIRGDDEKKTCIECHKGLTHRLPAMRTIDPSAVLGL
jgi:nitrate/TMAO reductase-like tetraheme cytochrome c subunit